MFPEQKSKLNLIIFILAVAFLLRSADAFPNEQAIKNGVVVHYDALLKPRCDLFLTRQIGQMFAGYAIGDRLIEEGQGVSDNGYVFPPPSLCKNYLHASSQQTIYRDLRTGDVVKKDDLISLDDMDLWKGPPPFRARFDIASKTLSPEDDAIDYSFLPYLKDNFVKNYVVIDKNNFEVRLDTGLRTGYRFYGFMGKCYLATDTHPRIFKYVTDCVHSSGEGYKLPGTIEMKKYSWINVTNANTIEQNVPTPSTNVEIDGASPVKPLIYSDFPLTHDGKVSKGRAMCMADCASGMLMKLLHVGQSIWGPSGKPPVIETHGTSQ
ncbi:hypothetical protein [Paraburkholderia phytofirmans]|uniref:Uncharacterized protein n=1 Tax=Paraburkholderia phytofirmans TaxID=261302 RepID=A0ABW9BQ94_9BURK